MLLRGRSLKRTVKLTSLVSAGNSGPVAARRFTFPTKRTSAILRQPARRHVAVQTKKQAPGQRAHSVYPSPGRSTAR